MNLILRTGALFQIVAHNCCRQIKLLTKLPIPVNGRRKWRTISESERKKVSM
jgi:hypothetical protein